MRGLVERSALTDWPEFARRGMTWAGHLYGGWWPLQGNAATQFSRLRQWDRSSTGSPHFQSRDYNRLNGGIERWFEPVTERARSSASLATVLIFCRKLFGMLSPSSTWHVEVHQFRIEARRGEAGRPTPEGSHRDGVDYVLVLLVNRTNIASGMTSVHDLAGTQLGEFTLTQPLDAALVDDARVLHGVTPVEPLDPATPGYRDVLVVTFRGG
jgi:hypothetical protein